MIARPSRRKLFDILFEGLPIGCFIVNKELEIVAFNHTAQELTGWEKKEAVGKRCSKIINSSLCQQFCPIKEGARNQKSFIAREAIIKNRFGEQIPICFSSSVVFDKLGKMEAGIELFRDRGGDERFQTLRNRIISIFAHDIKTPVSVTAGLAQRILSGKAGLITEKQREYLEFILKENQQVELLINNLLELLNIESGRLRPEPTAIDLRSFIKEVVDELRPKARERNIEIQYEIDSNIKEPLILDGLQLKRVFVNLVDNAIKYSYKGSYVKIKAELQNNWLIIKVSDQGIGIPKDDLPHIFEYFYRAKNSISKAGGTGLGLASARAIIEANGGRIWAKSKEGAGTTFFIRLPYRPDP